MDILLKPPQPLMGLFLLPAVPALCYLPQPACRFKQFSTWHQASNIAHHVLPLCLHVVCITPYTCSYLVPKESINFQRVLTVGTKHNISMVLVKTSKYQAGKNTRWHPLAKTLLLPPGNYLDSIKQGT